MVRSLVLFAAGRAGDPTRHRVLLARLERRGLEVVAPKCALIESMTPTRDDLQARADALSRALADLPAGTVVTGVGHSIGAALLMAMAGAQLWSRQGELLTVPRHQMIAKLVALAPPVGFFEAPKALEGLTAPIMLRVGSRDTITPRSNLEGVVGLLSARGGVDYQCVDGADHFTFMDQRPPGQDETMAQADAFRAQLADAIADFALDGIAS